MKRIKALKAILILGILGAAGSQALAGDTNLPPITKPAVVTPTM